MTHSEIIIDKDPCFEINTITREIKNMTEGKTSLIQYDHNSERFGFTMPRFVEGHDMMNCSKVEVHYTNKDGKMVEAKTDDVYTVEDVKTTEADVEKINFSWLISRNATSYAGSLEFSIKFICANSEGELLYEWNTDAFKDITIKPGKNNGEAIVKKYSDALEQMELELKRYIDAELGVIENGSY